ATPSRRSGHPSARSQPCAGPVWSTSAWPWPGPSRPPGTYRRSRSAAWSSTEGTAAAAPAPRTRPVLPEPGPCSRAARLRSEQLGPWPSGGNGATKERHGHATALRSGVWRTCRTPPPTRSSTKAATSPPRSKRRSSRARRAEIDAERSVDAALEQVRNTAGAQGLIEPTAVPIRSFEGGTIDVRFRANSHMDGYEVSTFYINPPAEERS